MASFDSQRMWNGIHMTIIFENGFINGFTDNKFLIQPKKARNIYIT